MDSTSVRKARSVADLHRVANNNNSGSTDEGEAAAAAIRPDIIMEINSRMGDDASDEPEAAIRMSIDKKDKKRRRKMDKEKAKAQSMFNLNQVATVETASSSNSSVLSASSKPGAFSKKPAAPGAGIIKTIGRLLPAAPAANSEEKERKREEKRRRKRSEPAIMLTSLAGNSNNRRKKSGKSEGEEMEHQARSTTEAWVTESCGEERLLEAREAERSEDEVDLLGTKSIERDRESSESHGLEIGAENRGEEVWA